MPPRAVAHVGTATWQPNSRRHRRVLPCPRLRLCKLGRCVALLPMWHRTDDSMHVVFSRICYLYFQLLAPQLVRTRRDCQIRSHAVGVGDEANTLVSNGGAAVWHVDV